MGILDNVQNEHPNNLVQVNIWIGSRHADRISESTQLTNPSESVDE